MAVAESLRVVVFQEGDRWVAQCLEHDIGAQAADLDDLHRRFTLTLQAELQYTMERFGKPFEGIPASPRHFHEMWDKCPGHYRPSREVLPADDGAPVKYEMAMCA